jgi:NAD-dependent SIR2 family protein deacetylase
MATANEKNMAEQDNPENVEHLKCHHCGETLEIEPLPAFHDEMVCPECRKKRVHETLLYIKELLNDSNVARKETAK